MKTRLHPQPGRSVLSLSPPILPLPLLLAALPACADINFTNIGWDQMLPVPGITCTDGSGQVYVKGCFYEVRLLAEDARMTGRLRVWSDLANQGDRTATFCGPAYLEVGTWDGTGTNFTPTGGVWCISHSGTNYSDGSSQWSMAGYGIGGSIEGLRFTATETRAAPGRSTDPYVGSGTIKQAPINTRAVADDFSDGVPWSLGGGGLGTYAAIETNGVFTIVGDWRGHPTGAMWETSAWAGMYTNWSVPEGQTLEVRVDLVNMNEAATGVNLALYHANGQGYALFKEGDALGLWKHNWGFACFRRDEQVTTPNTNVVLAFSISSSGQNVVLTGQVLHKQTGAVLRQVQCVDTPAADPTLIFPPDWGADSAGAPWKNGESVCLFVYQQTDGTKPPASATFDNLEQLKYEIPSIGIEPAVRLTWPSTGMKFGIEAAPAVNGPWLPVQDSVPPGFQQMTVRQSSPIQFFRAVQKP
jgi:hypothetical protein